ncbi:MAG TPA: hypothetical protein VHI52_09975 [Verrucomicrobiae bacterium]|nr:hypothetical protein [Verrucomicrobiae bacterium]
MSERANELASELFSGLKRMGSEIGAEMSRLGKQGANEMAAALFSNSDAFVQYGPGQVTREPEVQPEVEQNHEHLMEQ